VKATPAANDRTRIEVSDRSYGCSPSVSPRRSRGPAARRSRRGGKPLVVGSKRFTESYVLGEIATRTLVASGRPAVHRQGLGNTGILEQALASGSVDLYPEYTGTIVREILKREGNPSLDELNGWLAPRGLKVAVPLGFGNTYAIAMPKARADALGVRTLTDLAARAASGTAVRLGLSHEFLQRADGWPGLARAYGWAGAAPTGIDHGIAYDALAAGRIDATDVYSTDAQIERAGLVVLVDDRRFFPAYDAVLLMRREVVPGALAGLAGRIDARAMIAMNAEVELDGRRFADVAERFLARTAGGGAAASAPAAGGGAGGEGLLGRVFAPDAGRLLGQHLALVFGSLLLAVAAGVPLGIAAWRWPRAGQLVLATVGVLQTVPSLALLAVLIVATGTIGFLPAVLALFLYALLPIVRNTHAGLVAVAGTLRQAALALGLTPRQALAWVQLPIAWPTVLAGIRTAAVINVGTATMAAFIGAGGFGERIVAGLAVNDHRVMLAGALPAAALAIAVEAAFALLERRGRRRPA
jgi:osmoprotectant transport system permease protein